jgi:hypothetical protein
MSIVNYARFLFKAASVPAATNLNFAVWNFQAFYFGIDLPFGFWHFSIYFFAPTGVFSG